MKYCLLLAGLSLAIAASAQDGKLVISDRMHQYSGISPLSVKGDKLHVLTQDSGARIIAYPGGKDLGGDNVPYPAFHWDNSDDDLGYVIGGESANTPKKNAIYQWRVSTRKYIRYIDYAGRFTNINTGSTADTTFDNWIAFWSAAEHTVCAVDLTAKKTYCADYNAPDEHNHLPHATFDGDFVQITPKDSKSGLRYVILEGTPASYVYSVNEAAGNLQLVVRPEVVTPAMGHKPGQNDDGHCDPNETCLTSPHSSVVAAPDGQVYWVLSYGVEGAFNGNAYLCEDNQGALRLNAGALMTKPEKYAGFSGGGLKLILNGHCGGAWPAAEHVGCARNGSYCVVSFAPDLAATDPGKKRGQNWLLSFDKSGALSYQLIGATGATGNDYWSSPRSALSMDATTIVYDTDSGSSKTRKVYTIGTHVGPVGPPAHPLAAGSGVY